MADKTTERVELALAELREMFPEQRVSITETRRVLSFPDAKIKHDKETDYAITIGKGVSSKRFTASTLNEAMTEICQWHAEQARELKG